MKIRPPTAEEMEDAKKRKREKKDFEPKDKQKKATLDPNNLLGRTVEMVQELPLTTPIIDSPQPPPKKLKGPSAFIRAANKQK